jgi:hypothetical protein
MIKPLLITLASAALAIVPGVSTATPRAGDAAPAASAAPAPTEAQPKYCVFDTPTGSHIRKKTCLTREQWIKAYNFDPTEK